MNSGVRAARSSIISLIGVHFRCGHTGPIRYAYKADIEEWDQCPSTYCTVLVSILCVSFVLEEVLHPGNTDV